MNFYTQILFIKNVEKNCYYKVMFDFLFEVFQI